MRRRRPHETHENNKAVAAEHITALLPHLPAAGPLPWFVFDAGYDPVQLTPALGDTRAAILVCLRAGRCFYADPTAPPRTGRPRRHGHKFAGDVPATWPTPAGDLTVEDEQYGTVRVRAWRGLHPASCIPRPKTGTPSAICAADARWCGAPSCWSRWAACRSRPASRRTDLWLWWYGPPDAADAAVPNLDRAWRAYVRRCDLEHTFRFLKQTLNGTLPRVRHPEQADRWTWLVVLAYTQLRFARPLADDQTTSRCRGSRPSRPVNSRQPASAVRFRCFCHTCRSWCARQNPADARPDLPKARARDARYAIPPSPRPSSARPTSPNLACSLVPLLPATAPGVRRSPPHG